MRSARDERIDRRDAINIIGDGEEGASRESIRIRDESSGRRIMALVSCGWTLRPGPFSLPISLNAVQQLSRRVDLCARRPLWRRSVSRVFLRPSAPLASSLFFMHAFVRAPATNGIFIGNCLSGGLIESDR